MGPGAVRWGPGPNPPDVQLKDLAPSTSDGVDLIVNNTEFEKGLRVDGEVEGRWRKSKMTPASFLTALSLCCLRPHSRVVPGSHFCGQEALLELSYLGHDD